jgi:hypothetical protein
VALVPFAVFTPLAVLDALARDDDHVDRHMLRRSGIAHGCSHMVGVPSGL